MNPHKHFWDLIHSYEHWICSNSLISKLIFSYFFLLLFFDLFSYLSFRKLIVIALKLSSLNVCWIKSCLIWVNRANRATKYPSISARPSWVSFHFMTFNRHCLNFFFFFSYKKQISSKRLMFRHSIINRHQDHLHHFHRRHAHHAQCHKYLVSNVHWCTRTHLQAIACHFMVLRHLTRGL